MQARSPDLPEPPDRIPVRASSAHENIDLAGARRQIPSIVWRDETAQLHIQALRADRPITMGRSAGNDVVFESRLVSREHAEVVMRAHSRQADVSVWLLDLGSKNGTQYRPFYDRGAGRPAARLRPAPRYPMGSLKLEPGDHDVLLAREVWVRIVGVPIDQDATDEHEILLQPTPRERDVLIELCRSRYRTVKAATPSNAEIGARLRPPIGAERVSDILSQLYVKYSLDGTKEQNRVALVDLALEHRLVGPEDYG
jgi:FHA domain